jgi:hypothetical protein
MMSRDRLHSHISQRQSRRWATLWSTRSGPCSPSELLAGVRTLLDEAHRELREADLAEVLLASRSLAAPLSRGRAVPPPADQLAASSALSPAVRVYVRPLEVLLQSAASYSPARRRRLAAELTSAVEDIATRPRGSAVPTS